MNLQTSTRGRRLQHTQTFARNLFLSHRQGESETETPADGFADSVGDGAAGGGEATAGASGGDGTAAAEAAGMLAGVVGSSGAGTGKAKMPWISAMMPPSNMKVGGWGEGRPEGTGRERERNGEGIVRLF